MKSGPITVIAAPLRKQVIEHLREAIISFEFKPGDRLVERDLCERFDVSRTVIREALRHLEAEGLVTLIANRGPIVSLTTPEEAKCLYEVREALESMAAKLCAERASTAHSQKLARALAQVKSAYAKDDLTKRLQAKDEFYRLLCEGAENDVITSMFRSIQARVQQLRGLSLQTPGRAEQSLEELDALVKAIRDRDAELARSLAVVHVHNASSTAVAALANATAVERIA